MSYYIKKFWKINAIAILLGIVTTFGYVQVNLILMKLFQAIIDLDFSQFLFWCGVDLSLWAAIAILCSLRDFFQNHAIQNMNNQLRIDIAATLLQSDYRRFHSQDSGEYLSTFTNDVHQIEQLAWKPFFGAINAASTVTLSIIALLSLHWSLLVASLSTAAIMISAPKLFKEKLEDLSRVCSKEQASAVSKLRDIISGYDVLRFFGKDGRFMDGVTSASSQIETPKCHQSCTQAIIGQGVSYVSIICQMLINALIGILSIKGIIIQSALMGGGNLCGAIYNGLNGIANRRLSLISSKPYFDKITVHAEDLPSRNAEGLPPVREAVAVENLTFRYGEKPVLQNAAFRFEKGGKYALTGPSGCGKSTLLKLLLGWLPDYEGTITFDGQDAKAYTPEQLQKQMSYIEQDVFLFNTTIRDNITLGGDFTDEQIEKALQDSALAGDLAHMPLGLDTPVGEEGSALSGGQKQRVAIARALIHDRSILLVDEGTSALDQKNADIVEKSLLSNPDLTLILVSHHLTEERKAQFTQVFDLAA